MSRIPGFLIPLALACFSLAAVPSSPTVRETGRQLGKDVHSLYGSPEALEQRVYKPLTSTASMQTIDGNQSFGVRMSCNRQDDFLKVVILPNSRTSDVDTIRVYRDKNSDGTYRFSTSFTGPFAAVCTNGLLRCDAGATTGCQGRRWRMDGRNLVLDSVSADSVGGCYCYNASCGNDLLTTNREKVIEDIGLGVAQVLDAVYPRLSIGDHQVLSDNRTMTFSGQQCAAQSDCADGLDNDNDGLIDHPLDSGCSSPSDPDETDFQSVQPEQHYRSPEGLGRAVDVSNADADSLFRTVSNLAISSQYSDRSCRLFRQVALKNTLRFDGRNLDPDAFAVSTCGPRCREYRIGKLGDNYLSAGGPNSCGIVVNTARFTVNRPDLIRRVTLFRVSYDDFSSIRVNNQLVWSDPVGWMGGASGKPPCAENRGAGFRGTIDLTRFFTNTAPGGTVQFEQTIYFCAKGEGFSYLRSYRADSAQCALSEQISGNCPSLDSDPACALRQEVIDGVTVLDEYRVTGKQPSPSGKSFASTDGACTRTVTRDWWEKERTYACTANRQYDLSSAADRYERIHGSFDSDSGEFSDRRQDAQGSYTVHDETLSLPADDPHACIPVCKTKKPRPGVSMGAVGAVGDSPAWDYSYYECDTGGNCPAPSDEVVIDACGCGSSFKEAFLYMQMIHQLKSDFICTE